MSLKENGGVFLFCIFRGVFCAEDDRDVIFAFLGLFLPASNVKTKRGIKKFFRILNERIDFHNISEIFKKSAILLSPFIYQ